VLGYVTRPLVGNISLTRDEPLPLVSLEGINTDELDPEVLNLLNTTLLHINGVLSVANESPNDIALQDVSDTHLVNIFGGDVAEMMMENAGFVQALAFGSINFGKLFSPDGGGGGGDYRGLPRVGTQTGYTTQNAGILNRNMINAGETRPTGIDTHAHHIIPSTMSDAHDLRVKLHQLGIDINDAVNGVFLPREYHSKVIHGDNARYLEWVRQAFQGVETKSDAEAILRKLMQSLSNGNYP
jgi:hypothetical protein